MTAASTKAIRDLLLWARKEKIVLSSVQMGGITITVERDYNLQPPAGSPAAAQEAKRGIYEQFAGPLAPMLRGEQPTVQTNEPTEEDE